MVTYGGRRVWEYFCRFFLRSLIFYRGRKIKPNDDRGSWQPKKSWATHNRVLLQVHTGQSFVYNDRLRRRNRTVYAVCSFLWTMQLLEVGQIHPGFSPLAIRNDLSGTLENRWLSVVMGHTALFNFGTGLLHVCQFGSVSFAIAFWSHRVEFVRIGSRDYQRKCW